MEFPRHLASTVRIDTLRERRATTHVQMIVQDASPRHGEVEITALMRLRRPRPPVGQGIISILEVATKCYIFHPLRSGSSTASHVG